MLSKANVERLESVSLVFLEHDLKDICGTVDEYHTSSGENLEQPNFAFFRYMKAKVQPERGESAKWNSVSGTQYFVT